MPSYKRAVKAWVRRKVTGKGVALKRPIRTTFKAKSYHTKLKKYGTGVLGNRAIGYSQYRQYANKKR